MVYIFSVALVCARKMKKTETLLHMKRGLFYFQGEKT